MGAKNKLPDEVSGSLLLSGVSKVFLRLGLL